MVLIVHLNLDLFPILKTPKDKKHSLLSSNSLQIIVLIKTLLKTFDLERQQLRVVPADGQVTAVEPEARVATLLPHDSHLALIVEAPDITDLVGNFVTEHDPGLGSHVLVACGKDDLVGFELAAVGEAEAVGENGVDLLAVLDLDLALGDQLGSADVDVVASAALEVLEEETSAIGAAVDLEAGLVKTIENLLIVLGLLLTDGDLDGLEDGGGQAVNEKVGVVNLGSVFRVDALESDVSDGLGGDDVSAGSLDNGDVVALLEVVLSNVVSRVARSNNDGLLALAVLLSAGELGRVAQTVALEVLDTLHRGHVLLSGVTSRLDDVARVEGSLLDGAVLLLSLDSDGPRLGGVIPLGVDDGSPRPDVELQQRCVGLKELGELVLGGEDGPLGRELEVRHVVIPDRVVENQLVVSLPPVVADTVVLVDGDGLDAQHLKSGSGGQTSLAST